MKVELASIMLLLLTEFAIGQVPSQPIATPPPVISPPIVLPPVVSLPIATPTPGIALPIVTPTPIVANPIATPKPVPIPIPTPNPGNPNPTPIPNPTPNPSNPSSTPIPPNIDEEPGKDRRRFGWFRFLNGTIGQGREDSIDALPISIFDRNGDVVKSLLVDAINSIANVSGVATAMTSAAQGEAVATDNNIEVRMSQIRNASFGTSNPSFGSWAVGTGLFSDSKDTRSTTGTITAGVDRFIGKHMLVGMLGVYGYSSASIPNTLGQLLGNSVIGGIYYGVWTGEPGLYLTLSGLVNHTNFRMIEASDSSITNWTGFASVGYETSGEKWTFGPVASIQFDDTIASSSSLSSLLLHSNITSAIQSRLGFRLTNKSFFLKPQIQLMWEHRYSSNAELNVNVDGIPNSTAPIGEGPSNRDTLWGNLSVSYTIHSGWNLQGSYSFDVGNQFISQQVDVGIHVGF